MAVGIARGFGDLTGVRSAHAIADARELDYMPPI